MRRVPLDRRVATPIDPREPLSKIEKEMHGADAERCPETGFVFENGSGALPRAKQTELFKRRIAADAARPAPVDVSTFTTRPLGAPRS